MKKKSDTLIQVLARHAEEIKTETKSDRVLILTIGPKDEGSKEQVVTFIRNGFRSREEVIGWLEVAKVEIIEIKSRNSRVEYYVNNKVLKSTGLLKKRSS